MNKKITIMLYLLPTILALPLIFHSPKVKNTGTTIVIKKEMPVKQDDEPSSTPPARAVVARDLPPRGTLTPSTQTNTAQSVVAGSLKDYAKQRTLDIFGGGWENVDYIITHESGWRVGIKNSIGACGLGQALPCSKMPAGCLGNGKCEVDWTLQYILQRYGSTRNAKAFWVAHKWY